MTVGLKHMTTRYLHREEVKEYIAYYEVKQAKSHMESIEKYSTADWYSPICMRNLLT